MKARSRKGVVHLVGAGPGDPGLITLRGRELLARADVVVTDALVSPDLLDLVPEGAEVVHAGKRGGRCSADQAAVNRLLVGRARRGLRVVRLKGGDPGVFGRGGEEAEALRRAGVACDIVPGVTAALGAAAWTGIPLTHRGLSSSVALVTAQTDPGTDGGGPDWSAVARAGTVVVYMGVRRLAAVARCLLTAGMPPSTPAAVVRWATLPEQEIVTGSLATIAARARAAGVRAPALLLAGRVVALRPRPGRAGRRPLSGRTIVVTRPRAQAAAFVEALRERGARVLAVPAIELRPPRSWRPLDRALARGGYDILIFTSANGVERFFDRLVATHRDVRDLKGATVIAIGPATARAAAMRGLRVEALPEEYRAEGIVARLRNRGLRGARVLVPRAAEARDVLLRDLRRRGALVDVAPVYRTVTARRAPAGLRSALARGAVDLLTFTSSSTVTSFVRLAGGGAAGRALRRVPVAAIGPITAATARRAGFCVAVQPRAFTVPHLAAAITAYFRNSPSGTPRAS